MTPAKIFLVKFAKSFDIFILQSNCEPLLLTLKYVKIKHRNHEQVDISWKCKYAKVDIKLFLHCPILLDFSILFLVFWPGF